jgi:OOP family OmpA-OmpF porin
MTYGSKAKNATAENHNRDQFRAAVRGMVGRTAALQPESNPLEALGKAAAAAGPGGTVALIDSGLQTVAPLDFRQPGLLAADPDTVVAALARDGQLPDLHGRKVVLAGIGYTTEPQTALDENRRSHLIELWQKIVTRAGAESVEPVIAPDTTPSRDGLPTVATVTVPPPGQLDLGCNTDVAFTDNGPVGFRANSTEFADSTAAHGVLAKIARWLAGTPAAHADVVGSIAHYGTDDGNSGLSRSRAERVAAVLVKQGAESDQVVAEGIGWGPFPSKSAPPDDLSDSRNRRVVVRLLCD